MKDNKMIYLKSVGSYINPNTANIYPTFDNGKSDLANPISLIEDEVAMEWWDSLSKEDYETVESIHNSLIKIK